MKRLSMLFTDENTVHVIYRWKECPCYLQMKRMSMLSTDGKNVHAINRWKECPFYLQDIKEITMEKASLHYNRQLVKKMNVGEAKKHAHLLSN